jgi:hypothetical protein
MTTLEEPSDIRRLLLMRLAHNYEVGDTAKLMVMMLARRRWQTLRGGR